jgi:hypothetical protein
MLRPTILSLRRAASLLCSPVLAASGARFGLGGLATRLFRREP